MPKVFISYRRNDTDKLAGRLAADLKRQFGQRNVFFDLDRETNAPGTKWIANIDKAISNTHIALVMIGDQWCDEMQVRSSSDETDIVRYEILALLSRGVDVMPLQVDNARLPTVKELGSEMAGLFDNGAFRLTQWNWDNDYKSISACVRRSQSFGRALADYFKDVIHSRLTWLFVVLTLLGLPIIDLAARYSVYRYYLWGFEGSNLDLLLYDHLSNACVALNQRLNAYSLSGISCP